MTAKADANVAEIGSGTGSDLAGRNGALPAMAREERGRADVYRLLAMLLESPPDRFLHEAIVALPADDTAIGEICGLMSGLASRLGRDAIVEEYSELFVGAPKPLLMPYASYYPGGQLFGRALAELRMDLPRLGIARNDNTTEPEDHIATLCEIMSGLLVGAFGRPPMPLQEQGEFYSRHLQPWAGRFFADLEAAEPSNFYMTVARLGVTFIEIETESFRMV